MFYHDTRWPSHSVTTYTATGVAARCSSTTPQATGDAHQETFLSINRPTDIDVDGSGRMYVSSWQGGGQLQPPERRFYRPAHAEN